MTELEPTPLPPGAREEKIAVQPGFMGAWRGIWLLTWRGQFSWQRLPGRAAVMLVLPFLVFITTQSPEMWARRHAPLDHLAPPQLNRLVARLRDAKLPLQPQQQIDLMKIFAEEYAATGMKVREAQAEENAELRSERLHDASATCAERIMRRAQEVLDESQFAKFKSFEADNRRRMEALINTHQETWSRSARFYHWLVDVYFFIVLPLSCVWGCGALMRDELQADTLGFLVTRPVSRARLLCVKYLSQLAWLEILLLTETLLLFSVGAGRQISGVGMLLPLFVAVQLLAVPAWCALGTFFGQITSRYMVIALIYGGIVEMGIGRIPTNINTLSLMRHLKILLSHNGALQSIYEWPSEGTWLSMCALAIAPVLFLGLAAALFSFLEYLPSSESRK
ncbi:MAG: ABC transporter permease [Limisphaerales bacterium]